MGNSTPASPPPLDARVLRCKEIFMLNQGDIGAFWGVFKQFDPNGEGCITREAFFDVIHEERNKVGDAVFTLADAKHENQLEFGEFVQAVSSFCCLSVPDMLKFCFIINDKNHSGFIEIEELHDLITVLHSSDVSKNVQNAIGNLQMDEYGRLSFERFKDINKNFPQVLYPVFRLQQSIKRRILGIQWWKRKIDELDYWRENKERLKQAEKTKEDKRRIRQRNAQIRKVMGLKEYFFNPNKRQIYVEALSQNVPDVTPLGTTAATSDDPPLKAAVPR